MKQVKTSIALATYNGGKYLKAQLESFLNQTCKPDELIISDDGSSDDTLSIIRNFSKISPFPVILSQNERNLGYGGNFNQALMKTNGDLVFLSDQDDVWYPNKIERILRFSEKNKDALVLMNDAALTDGELNRSGFTKLGQIRSAGFSESTFVMGACLAVRRELLNVCLPIPEKYHAHDSWIAGIAEGMNRKDILPIVLQDYRRHGGNESRWLVNSTSRITRWHAVIDDIRTCYSLYKGRYETFSADDRNLEMDLIMLSWAESICKENISTLVEDISRLASILRKKNKLQVGRMKIRELDFIPRLRAIFKFWRAGNYQSYSGIKSAIRDLFL